MIPKNTKCHDSYSAVWESQHLIKLPAVVADFGEFQGDETVSNTWWPKKIKYRKSSLSIKGQSQLFWLDLICQ